MITVYIIKTTLAWILGDFSFPWGEEIVANYNDTRVQKKDLVIKRNLLVTPDKKLRELYVAQILIFPVCLKLCISKPAVQRGHDSHEGCTLNSYAQDTAFSKNPSKTGFKLKYFNSQMQYLCKLVR